MCVCVLYIYIYVSVCLVCAAKCLQVCMLSGLIVHVLRIIAFIVVVYIHAMFGTRIHKSRFSICVCVCLFVFMYVYI